MYRLKNQKESPCKVVRRELIRAGLERMQGSQMGKLIEKIDQSDPLPEGLFGVEEILNNPYMNRSEVPLAMDIFKPLVPEGQELPVILMVHGGGLVTGDRRISRRAGRVLAGRGYLVFSLEYRLAPRANTAGQLDDICAGMDLVGEKLVDFDVDFGRIFLMAESAGAFLAVYVAAMKHSKKLQAAIGYAPSRMYIKALGLVSGMFYTNRSDPIGWLMAEQFYGDKGLDPVFLQYMNPEHPEILDNLPPVFLITSRGDFLNNYTLMYYRALKAAGRKSHLLYYGDKELPHSFVTISPGTEKSSDALDRMLAWFEAQAEAGRPSNKKGEGS